MADYTVLATPTDSVTSVSGRTGAITLTSSDVGLGNVENVTLSTWNGSNNIMTVGEITNGTWSGGTIALNKGGTGATTAAAARTALGVDAAGTDNSTDVSLANVTDNYLTISDQTITAGTVPLSLGGTGATTASAARSALGVDAAGTDNSTDVSLAQMSLTTTFQLVIKPLQLELYPYHSVALERLQLQLLVQHLVWMQLGLTILRM